MRQGEDRRRSRMPFVIVSAVWPWHFLVIDFEHGRLDVGFSLSPLAIRQRAQSNWGRIRLGSIVSQYFTSRLVPLVLRRVKMSTSPEDSSRIRGG